MTVAVKRCCRCKLSQPRDAFGANARSLDMLQPYCKVCAKHYAGDHAERRAERREELKAVRTGLDVAGERVQHAIADYDREAVALGEQLNKLRMAALKVAEEIEHAKGLVRDALQGGKR